MRWSCFICPITGSIAQRRRSKRFNRPVNLSSGEIDLGVGWMMLRAAVTAVYKKLGRLNARQLVHLRVRRFERVAIVGIAVQRLDAHHPTALRSGHYRHLATKFILLVLFPFSDAFHFWRLHAVELVLVRSLLLLDALGAFERLRQ